MKGKPIIIPLIVIGAGLTIGLLYEKYGDLNFIQKIKAQYQIKERRGEEKRINNKQKDNGIKKRRAKPKRTTRHRHKVPIPIVNFDPQKHHGLEFATFRSKNNAEEYARNLRKRRINAVIWEREGGKYSVILQYQGWVSHKKARNDSTFLTTKKRVKINKIIYP